MGFRCVEPLIEAGLATGLWGQPEQAFTLDIRTQTDGAAVLQQSLAGRGFPGAGQAVGDDQPWPTRLGETVGQLQVGFCPLPVICDGCACSQACPERMIATLARTMAR